MSRRTKFGIAAVALIGIASTVFALTAAKRSGRAQEVRLGTVERLDLVAAVTASGRIEAERQVDISADITGRIVDIAVNEGDLVTKGQYLIQIDPAQYESAVKRLEGLLASNQATLIQAQTNRDQAKRQLDRWVEMRKINAALVSLEQVEQAQQQYDVAVANTHAAEAGVEQARGSLAEARDQLAKTRLVSPISGRVVRLPVEVGEVAVPGTFSRETGRLMTVADLSRILAKVKVDETDVVRVSLGDSVEVTIDAFPDSAFTGRVTKISNAATVAASSSQGGSSTDRAVDFDVEVTLDAPPAGIRPDLSATARIVTDTRDDALAIPIIALTVRQHEDLPNELKPRDPRTRSRDREGVFVVQSGIATFKPVRVGIAGDEYFEVLEGIGAGDSIVSGPYQAVRDLRDSTRVKPSRTEAPGTRPR